MKPKFKRGQKVWADIGDFDEIIPVYTLISDLNFDGTFYSYSFKDIPGWMDERTIFVWEEDFSKAMHLKLDYILILTKLKGSL